MTQETTDHILATTTQQQRNKAWEAGIWHAQNNQRPHHAYQQLAHTRTLHGFKYTPNTIKLTSHPDTNAKLDKATQREYGWTNQSAHNTLSNGQQLDSCGRRGLCTKVCVLKTGHGEYPSVQRARNYKTEFLALHTLHYILIVAYEMEQQTKRHTNILLRPKVNDDIRWNELLPQLAWNGWNGQVTSLGYTKWESIFQTMSGWHGPWFRESYSINESSNLEDVANYVKTGGSVTLVTDRPTGQPIQPELVQKYLSLPTGATVVDADLTDEFILDNKVSVGDLSAKGKARNMRGGFVARIYQPPTTKVILIPRTAKKAATA